jgi:hypothetical protein
MAHIRDVTGEDLQIFGEIVARLERLDPETDLRPAVLADLMKLLRADFGASYLWRADLGSFQHGFGFNMNPLNLKSYDEWYQFRDPMTAKLRQRRRASFVEEVLPRRDMLRTEFYNDFVARDGLDHGINM